MVPDIILARRDAELSNLFEKEIGKTGNTTSFSQLTKTQAKNGHHLVIINTEGEWDREIKQVQKLQEEGQEFYTILAPAPLLKKTIKQIRDTASVLHAKAAQSKEGALEKANGHEPNLAELVEKKLAVFVKKVKNCEMKNLYGLLIQEFEKPLINLALKETEGNQIQAAQLLGMNRNTLRKKIKELKITVEKKKK
ncbi:MAG: hypothetical protein HY282_01535 [Nitrospirae bacterium]|nr:hypothetical protein [Candidatus Manganitrophaceae bacterium]